MTTVLQINGFIGLNNDQDMNWEDADAAIDAIIEALEAQEMYIFSTTLLTGDETLEEKDD